MGNNSIMLSVLRFSNGMLVVNTNLLAKILLGMIITYAFTGFKPFQAGVEDLDINAVADGSFFRKFLFISFFVLSFFCFFAKRGFNNIRKVSFILIPLGFCLVSFFWSVEPSITIRRVVLLLLSTSTIFFLVSVLSKEEIFNVLYSTLAILVFVSILAVPFISGAVHQGDGMFQVGLAGNWKGVFIHKNHAGPAAVVLIFMIISKLIEKPNLYLVMSLFLVVFFLLFTKSKTSLGLLFPAVFMAYFYYRVNRSRSLKGISFVALLGLLIVLFIIGDYVFRVFSGVLNDPSAFTGRSTMWNLLYQLIADNIILGVGFGAVWGVGDSTILSMYGHGWIDWVFTYNQGHNGYLDVAATIGVLGLLITIYFIFFKTIVKLISLERIDLPTFFWCSSVFSFVVFHNLLESSLYGSSEGIWLIFLVVFFTIHSRLDCS